MHNLLSQFTPAEMVAVGAYYVGHARSIWTKEKPHIFYGLIHPPENWRGHRWILLLQFPALLLTSIWVLFFFRCKVIFVVYPDHLFLLAGYLLSKIFNKPLYAYFHNTYLENNPNSRLAHWLQPMVFKRAKHIFVMSEGLESYYKKLYPDLKCSALVHTTMKYLEADNVVLPPIHNPLRLVFAGNVNASCSEAMGRFVKLIKNNPEFSLQIYSGMRKKTFQNIGIFSDNIVIANVPYDFLLNHIQKADVVIHPHGFLGEMALHEYETIFPTKTIEYLQCRRPILAHVPADSFIAKFYRERDCALLVCEPTVEALYEGLMQISKDDALRKKLVTNALKAARRFYAPNVIQRLRDVIGAVV